MAGAARRAAHPCRHNAAAVVNNRGSPQVANNHRDIGHKRQAGSLTRRLGKNVGSSQTGQPAARAQAEQQTAPRPPGSPQTPVSGCRRRAGGPAACRRARPAPRPRRPRSRPAGRRSRGELRQRTGGRVQGVAHRTGQADRDAAGRGGAHRPHRRHAAPDQQRHGHAAAADADHRRHRADARTPASGHRRAARRGALRRRARRRGVRRTPAAPRRGSSSPRRSSAARRRRCARRCRCRASRRAAGPAPSTPPSATARCRAGGARAPMPPRSARCWPANWPAPHASPLPCGMPTPGSSQASAATSTSPPPTPSRPASTPAIAPSARNNSNDQHEHCARLRST